jgi:hypothetical protein
VEIRRPLQLPQPPNQGLQLRRLLPQKAPQLCRLLVLLLVLLVLLVLLLLRRGCKLLRRLLQLLQQDLQFRRAGYQWGSPAPPISR